jgi:hypothetical protein
MADDTIGIGQGLKQLLKDIGSGLHAPAVWIAGGTLLGGGLPAALGPAGGVKTERLFAAGTPTAYRSAVVAADVLGALGTVTCTKQAGGAATAGTYTVFVVPGNRYGWGLAKQGDTTVTTETTNLTVRVAWAAMTGYDRFRIFCSTAGAGALFVGQVTETQRAAGGVIATVNVVTAGGIPGAMDIQIPGTGLAVNGGQYAQNTAYLPESLTPITPGTAENVRIHVDASRTGDIVAASLVLIPFYAGASGHYYAGDPVPVSFGGVANAYESTQSGFDVPARGQPFVIVAGGLAGTGLSVNLESVTS